MKFCLDGKGQQAVYWQIGNGAWKVAWIQDRSGDPTRDWAGTGLYLNVNAIVMEESSYTWSRRVKPC